MANLNRAALITKAHKVLKQHYKPVLDSDERPLLEQMLFACCLENAPYDAALKVYQRIKQNFFDWNEVRVSTVTELAEALRELPDPSAAAANLKKILQGVFESTYSFDLEVLKKQNISTGVNKLQELEGVTPFVLGFTVQHALSGHAIPLDRGALDVLLFVGIATPNEVRAGSISGLDRAIPKNKGIEFASLLHQFAADYIAAPHSPNVRKILLAINASATMPKRGSANKPEEKPAAAQSVKSAESKPELKGSSKDGKTAEKKPTVDEKKGKAAAADALKGPEKSSDKSAKHEKPEHAAADKNADKNADKKSAKPAAKTEKHPAPKPTVSKHPAAKPPVSKHPAPKHGDKSSLGRKKPISKSQNLSVKKKSASKQLAKKKPR